MVKIFAVYKKLLRGLMSIAGVKPQMVEIEPGTAMHFWVGNDVAENKQTKSKPAVVFLHGFAADGIITWQFQVFALARNYRVYVPDLIFFGGSLTDKPDRSLEFQAECLVKGLRKLGVESCTLVGFSYGGMVGFKMAQMYPELVESMVITGSVMALTKSFSCAALETIGFNSWSDLLLPNSAKGVQLLYEIATYKLPKIPNFIYKNYLEVMFDNRKEKVELLRALEIDDKDFTLPHNYPQRVHLLWGGNDMIFTREVANNLKRQLGDRAMLQYIEKAGHLVQIERPCIYNRLLKQILATPVEDRLKRH